MFSREASAVPAPHPPLIEALLDPARYGHPVERIELLETHISWVVLAGPYAYKIKKPLDLGFLDFSTLEKRRLYCEEELRLNRRRPPGLYPAPPPPSGAPGEVSAPSRQTRGHIPRRIGGADDLERPERVEAWTARRYGEL